MKARNLLKILFTMTAVFAFTATFAQTVPYTDMSADQNTGTDSVTVNSKMVYYVEPDNALNSISGNYDTTWTQSDAESNGVNSLFDFRWEGSGSGSGSINTPDAWADAPYRTIRFTGTGNLDLQAQEIRELDDGTECAGDVTTLSIEVINAPEFTVGGTSTEICHADGNTEDIEISGYNVAAEGGDVYLKYDMDVYTDTDGDGTFDNEESSATDEIVKLANPDDGSGPSTTVLTGETIVAVNDQPTRYRYDFGGTIEGTDNNGINDYVSRKSDYFEKAFNDNAPGDGDFSYYAATDTDDTDKIVEFIVYPAPNTGDIYYIPNDEFHP